MIVLRVLHNAIVNRYTGNRYIRENRYTGNRNIRENRYTGNWQAYICNGVFCMELICDIMLYEN